MNVEEYLRKVMKECTGNKDNEASHPTISLTKWTKEGDSNA